MVLVRGTANRKGLTVAQDIAALAASYRADGNMLRNGTLHGRMYMQRTSSYFQIFLLGYVERFPYRYQGQYLYSMAWREPVPARLGGGRVTVTEPTQMTYRWRRNGK